MDPINPLHNSRYVFHISLASCKSRAKKWELIINQDIWIIILLLKTVIICQNLSVIIYIHIQVNFDSQYYIYLYIYSMATENEERKHLNSEPEASSVIHPFTILMLSAHSKCVADPTRISMTVNKLPLWLFTQLLCYGQNKTQYHF